ncbi:MAG: hypothetical protein ACI8X5_001940 [Planctomycetota bacterium]
MVVSWDWRDLELRRIVTRRKELERSATSARKTRNAWLVFAGILSVPVLSFMLLEYALTGWVFSRSFSSSAWKAAASDGISNPGGPRRAMIASLLADETLAKLERTAIRELLGPDDSMEGTGYGRGYFTQWDEVYFLGDATAISMDSDWLVIRYDSNARVSEYRLVTD